MPALNNVPIPLNDPIATPRREGQNQKLEGLLTVVWQRWFDQLGLSMEAAPSRVANVPLTSQSASIGATDMSSGATSAGLYRVTYYARITQAAGLNSSLTVSFDWTDGGVAQSYSGAAMVGNLVTTYQSNTQMINVDALSPIRYSSVYASAGAPAMLYSLYVVLEEILA
jgi:hypothetical protein